MIDDGEFVGGVELRVVLAGRLVGRKKGACAQPNFELYFLVSLLLMASSKPN